MKNKLIFSLSLGIALFWLSLFLSFQPLPNPSTDNLSRWATGGFPFKVFDYPANAMGGGVPPADSWPRFFASLAFWLVVGYVLSLLFYKKIKNEKLIVLTGVSATLLTIFGMLYILIKFD